jgi:hypothetical protein
MSKVGSADHGSARELLDQASAAGGARTRTARSVSDAATDLSARQVPRRFTSAIECQRSSVQAEHSGAGA